MPLFFPLSIFTGSFLLFIIQPLLSKAVLPYVGGAPAVWIVCMLFFQVLLLGGYAYAALAAKLSESEEGSLYIDGAINLLEKDLDFGQVGEVFS